MIACVTTAQAIRRSPLPHADNPEADLKASLITCYPGPEIYELVGHEALRIYGREASGLQVDSVWNYGVFDFTAPGFVWRFVKGETDYMVQGYPFRWFMPQYEQRGSRVVEQVLDLTPDEVSRLRRMLQINALPENRFYRYSYIRDNCSTRIVAMLDSAVAPQRIIYPDSVGFATFREAMRYYHRHYPWYQFGIDIALGAGIDMPLTSRMEQFAPLRLMEEASEARLSDGRPLVGSTIVLYSGLAHSGGEINEMPPVLPATPWYLTPMCFAVLIMIISIGVAAYAWVRRRMIRWWMSMFFALLGIAGCVVWFLVFVSSHDATSPNLLFLWLNPMQLVIAIGIWWRVTRPVALAMSLVDLIIMIVLAGIWPLQPQSANPAVFPLWAATIALAAAYARVYPTLRSRDGGATVIRKVRNTSSTRKKTNGRKKIS